MTPLLSKCMEASDYQFGRLLQNSLEGGERRDLSLSPSGCSDRLCRFSKEAAVTSRRSNEAKRSDSYVNVWRFAPGLTGVSI